MQRRGRVRTKHSRQERPTKTTPTRLVPRDAAADVGRLAKELVVEEPRAPWRLLAAAAVAAITAIVISADAEQLRAGHADGGVEHEVVESAADAPRACFFVFFVFLFFWGVLCFACGGCL